MWRFVEIRASEIASEETGAQDDDQYALAMRIAEPLRPHVPKTARAFDGIMGVVLRHEQASPPDPQQGFQSERLKMPDLEDPAARTQFFSETVRYLTLPYMPIPQRAGPANCSAERGAWPRASNQIRENSVAP